MNRSRGRRQGSPDTRGQILAAARVLFREHGYAKTTLRSVAADAGVDAALVSYFFGSKHGLFAEALTLTVSPADVMKSVVAGGRAELSQRAVVAVQRAWAEPADVEPLRSLIASLLAEPEGVPAMGEFLEREVLGPLADTLGSDQKAREQAAVIVMLISGVVISRQLLGIDALAAVPDRKVRRLVGEAIEAVIACRVR